MDRNFIFISFFIVTLSHSLVKSSFDNVMTSGYSTLITTYLINDGSIVLTNEIPLEENMTFAKVEDDLSTLFAIHEVSQYGSFVNSGAISRWAIGSAGVGLPIFSKVQVVSSNGSGPCYINVDRGTGYLHVADYSGSIYTSYKVDSSSGEILDLAFTKNFGPGSNVFPDRQAESHPHGTFSFQNFVYVTDLGADKIWHFQITSNGIVEGTPAFTATPPGSGPRHMAFDFSKQLAYVIHELKSTVDTYRIDPSNGSLNLIVSTDILEHTPIPQEQHTWPYQYPAEIEIHPGGRFMYVTNRGTGALIVFSLQDDGSLNFVQYQPVSGTLPRYFKIHPDGNFLLVAMQDTNLLELFQIDQTSGILTKHQEIVSNNSPTIITFF